jgi:hypothetical protein
MAFAIGFERLNGVGLSTFDCVDHATDQNIMKDREIIQTPPGRLLIDT